MIANSRPVIEKLNGQNYETWCFKMKMLLIRDDFWATTDGTSPCPEAVFEGTPPVLKNAPEISKWKAKDAKALSIIGLEIEDSQLPLIRKAVTAREAWNSLKAYHQKSTLSNKVSLLKQICRMQLKDDGSMENHLFQMENLFERLANMGKNLEEDFRVALILSSLPDKYNTLTTALEARNEEDLTINLVKSKLLDEFRKNHVEVKTDNLKALKVQSTKSNFKCNYCKKIGHVKKNCYKWKAQNKSESEKSENSKSRASNDKNSKNDSNSKDHSYFCFVAANKEFCHDWIIDSGASNHMSADPHFFTQIRPHKSPVHLANGNKIFSVGIGNGFLKCVDEDGEENTVEVKEILFVPDLRGNLISVQQLAQRGLNVNFENDLCKIQIHNRTIAIAKATSSKLYRLVQPNSVSMAKSDLVHRENCIHNWHRRLGHREIGAVQKLKDNADGIHFEECGIKQVCECCLRGKQSRSPFPESNSKSKEILEIIHTDVCTMDTPTPSGHKYFVTFIDDFSKYTEIYLMKRKSDTFDKFKKYILGVQTQFNKKVKTVRSDNGGEYINESFKTFCAERGIACQYTVAYSPQQNGVAERKNRYLTEMVRCMLIDAKLGKKYWGEAIMTANYIQNRCPSRSVGTTPYEKWYGRKPNLKNLKIFGTPAFVHIPREKRRKLDEKSQQLLFVGYSENSKAWRFLDKDTDDIYISRDVKFIELNNGSSQFQDFHVSNDRIVYESSEQEQQEEEIDASSDDDTIEIENSNESFRDESDASFMDCNDRTIIQDSENDTSVEEETSNNTRRSQRSNFGVPPDRFTNSNYMALFCEYTPSTFKEASNSNDKDQWYAAMREEINSLNENHTWNLVKLPDNRKAIGNKWVFKIKEDEKGNPIRYRARLVAMGYLQKQGIDFDQVFAPVAKNVTFRLLLTVASNRRMCIEHFDIKTAFLYGELDEDIFMKQPEGFIEKGKENFVCKLKKSIYGLKQSARKWNEKVKNVLMKNGFKQSSTDPCLFIKTTAANKVIYVLIHVDDFLVSSEDRKDIRDVAQFLSKEFSVKSLGDVKNFLGMEITKTSDGTFLIGQKVYVQKILKSFGLEDAKTSKIPMDPGYLKAVCDNYNQLPNNENYQRLIGALLYLSVNTRPDIAVSTSILSRKITSPNQQDWTELKRVVRYLKFTADFKLKLGGIKNQKLIGYADADWASNVEDRKSNSGVLFQFGGGVISWLSRKQTTVALSSTEAEYVSLAECVKECIWLRRLLIDFNEEQTGPTVIYEDNQSCLKLIESEKPNKRTKHIDTKFKFIRDYVLKNIIKCEYCPTAEMIADILTKPLEANKIAHLRDLIGLIR